MQNEEHNWNEKSPKRHEFFYLDDLHRILQLIEETMRHEP